MAATQAENQQNDVNSEKVQPDQQYQHPIRNSLLQNGTDKSGVRGGGSVAVTKPKNTAGKNLAIEMSQYRQDGNGNGGGSVVSSVSTPSAPSVPVPTSSTGSPATPVSVTSEPGIASEDSGQSVSLGPSVVGPGSGPDNVVYPSEFTYGRDMHNINSASEGGVHAFGPRQAFGAKQPPVPGPPFGHTQHPHPPRFVSGQSLSQPTGPTPTLNQLLQSSNPLHRYPNSYSHADQPYNQGWPPQKSLTGYGAAGSSGPGSGPVSSSGPYRNQSTLSPAYGGSSVPSPGYGDNRAGWAGPPVSGHGQQQHGPGSPGPPNSSAPTGQPSPQPSQPSSHSPGPGLPPSPQQHTTQHQGFPSRPAQPTTPNAHGPDPADLSGGNSNDSSGGPAPGTPNSQGMRPTPSPTGSTGSRSMSPAVGQQNIPMPPRPSSGQSDGSGSTRMSHSPMGTQGNYPSPHPGHVHGYKGHTGIGPSGQSGQPMTMYQPNQQYSGGYSPRPQSNIQYPGPGYGPGGSQPPPANSISTHPYPNRSAPNHMVVNSQFPPYQSWPNPSNVKGNGPPQTSSSPAPSQTGQSSPPRPPHYLKQHLQHKMGFGTSSGPGSVAQGSMPPSPSPPQNYHMGPPGGGHQHSGMGPPPTMGPPNMPPTSSPLLPNNHTHDGPMPPPSSTPNSHMQIGSELLDNGITTTPQSNLGTHITATSVTSVVTTGPDGAPVDEGSQQSTLSNASAASGEDPQCTTPKSGRKNDMGHYSHPTTPQSTVPSPMHEEYGELSSPSWPRTPASPKTDSLGKLYEMDDSPERRAWLDKLLAFMEERRTPITTCPTISKNPLDLFRLYVYVKDRGGFMEVTKNKTWKDIAGMLGIGASSSAAYTLRKHYTKNLLAYECQFDRGGIDPQPIINQVEASSKKKGAKAASVPSPGSSNSQDSFPPPGSGGASMDGYGGYGYPPGGNPDYNAPQRPSSQGNAQSPHSGSGGANHLNNAASGGPSPAGGAADNVSVSNPFDDVSPSPPPRGGPFPGGAHPPYPGGTPPRSQGQPYGGQPGYNQYPGPGPGPGGPPDQYSPYSTSSGYPPAVRPVYPPYSGDSGAPPPAAPATSQGTSSTTQDPYRYIGTTPTSGYTPRPQAPYGGTTGNSGPPTSQPPPANYPPQQDYYRQGTAPGPGPGPEQTYNNPQGTTTTPTYGSPAPNKNMPPPGPQIPRRHPDFVKDQQQPPQQQPQQQPYPPYSPRPPPQMYSNWPNNNQYRPPQYTGSGTPQVGSQSWPQGGRPSGQWDQYPTRTQNYQSHQQGGQPQWTSIATPGVGQSSPLRPPLGPRPGKPFSMPPQSGKGTQPQPAVNSSYSQSQIPKREITFPPDSVEATVPVLYRRKRLCRSDLNQVDAWRIIMSLRSGLLSESTYALDMLNVLLFDDSSVSYFGLNQWPGLLDLLLEHFRKSLSDMFDEQSVIDEPDDKPIPDLGGVTTPIDPNSKTVILHNTTNFSHQTRKGQPVKIVEKSKEIFIQDHIKDWDVRGDANKANIIAAIDTDPWHHNAEHILPTFHAELCCIPFNMRLTDTKQCLSCKEESDRQRTPPPEEAPPPPPKNSDKKLRTKTLSDVISRIKKDSSETNDVLTLDNVKTEVVSEKSSEEQNSVDLSANVNGECGGENKDGQKIRDIARTLKRRRISDYEDEAYTRDEASLVLLTESQDNIGKRCVCISNILRSLTFVPGNESEFTSSPTFLALVGKLLLLHHEHPPRTQKTRNYDREEDADFADSCSSLQGESEWWWDFLTHIRENILVSIANIAGQIDVSQYSEDIARPLLDGLLHWAICPSATGQDPFASVGPSSLLSPQRLALEALCKLCVTNSNVDLVIATPPFSRLERLCAVLTKHLCRSEDQVLREFSINLLHYLAAADSSMARIVAAQTPCVSLLVAFIEQAEQSALGVANQHGISALRDNPDSMGTSLDMLRRAAATLVFLARHPDNRALLVQQESRLLALVMSQILDQQVALLLSKVLFQISNS